MQTIRFGTDGVRESAGKWPIDIDGAQRIGLGVGKYLKEQGVADRSSARGETDRYYWA